MLIFFCKIHHVSVTPTQINLYPILRIICVRFKVNKVLEDYNLANPKEFLCSKIAIVHAC